jgi:hypothetical protein
VRRGLTALAGGYADERRLGTDLWLGLVVLLGYLQLWNVFFAITWATWALPLAVAAGGLVMEARRIRRPRPSHRLLVAGGLAGLAVLWLANHALARATDYDLGLYHLNIIDYAERYATIPGLANLQTRLGASDPHLLLAAFLDRGPWAGAAWHLVDGLLVSLLVVELASRLGRRHDGPPSFTRRVAWLLIPATVVVIGANVTYRLSSPNLDLACYVLVVAGMLYLADCVENGVRPTAALASGGTLAAASATRPLYWLSTIAVVGVLAYLLRGGTRPARAVASLCVLPVVLAVGWMVRQAILSGYPLYPVKVGALPVDWRVPTWVVDYTGRWTSSWARWPGHGPDEVLASWHWLRAFWLPAQEKSIDVIAPLALLACLIPALAVGTERPALRTRTRPMLAVALPSLVTLVVWFVEAPDPRFVLASIWLLPISLVAWALPPLARASAALVAAGIGAGIGLAVVGDRLPAWFLPAAVLLWLYLLLVAVFLRKPGWRAPLARAALLSTAVAGAAVVVHNQSLHPVDSRGSGPAGIDLEEVPDVVMITTRGGLRLQQPRSAETGNDQCFGVLVCTAALSDPALRDHLLPLHLRGTGVAAGFSAEERTVEGRAVEVPAFRRISTAVKKGSRFREERR